MVKPEVSKLSHAVVGTQLAAQVVLVLSMSVFRVLMKVCRVLSADFKAFMSVVTWVSDVLIAFTAEIQRGLRSSEILIYFLLKISLMIALKVNHDKR